MNTIKKLFYNHTAISTLISVVVLMGLLRLLRMLPLPYEITYIFSEIVVAVITLFIIYSINGEGKLLFSTKDIGYAFKLAWWPLLVAILQASLLMFNYLLQGNTVLGNPFLIVLGAIVLAIFVGFFEEGLYRGIVLNAFLKKLGGSFKGIFLSCIYSSIIFGFVHVYSNFFNLFINPSTITIFVILQIIGKTLSVALLGFILAVIFLKTHNLFIIAIVHTINDLGLFIPSFLFEQQGLTNYVNSNSTQGMAISIGYIV